MKIALLTDTHIWHTRTEWVNILSHWEDIIDHVKELVCKLSQENIETVIFLGDMIDFNSQNIKKSYEELLSIFYEFRVHWIFGNNESFIESKGRFSFPQKTTYPHSQHMIEWNNIHIFIHIEKEARELINVSDDELNRVERLSQQYKNKNIYWYMHYPITEDTANLTHYHIRRPKDCFPINSIELRKVAEQYNVKTVFSGHTHLFFQSIMSWVNYLTVPSFSESKSGKPQLEYAILDTVTDTVSIHCL